MIIPAMLDQLNYPRVHTIALDRQNVRELGVCAGEMLRERFSRCGVAICLGREPTSWRGRAMPGERLGEIDLNIHELRELMENLARRAMHMVKPFRLYQRLCRQFPFAAALGDGSY